MRDTSKLSQWLKANRMRFLRLSLLLMGVGFALCYNMGVAGSGSMALPMAVICGSCILPLLIQK